MKTVSIPKNVRQALDATGLTWTVELGGHHFKLKLEGRLVGVLPLNGGNERGCADRRTISQIKRAARDLTVAA